jgi:hypothetical protein
VFVLDPEIVSNGKHFLAHLIAVSTATGPAHLAVFTPFFTSIFAFVSSHDIYSCLYHKSVSKS